MSEFITIQTQIGWIAGKIIDEQEDKYILEFGGKKQYEVLKEDIFSDEDGELYALWW